MFQTIDGRIRKTVMSPIRVNSHFIANCRVKNWTETMMTEFTTDISPIEEVPLDIETEGHGAETSLGVITYVNLCWYNNFECEIFA